MKNIPKEPKQNILNCFSTVIHTSCYEAYNYAHLIESEGAIGNCKNILGHTSIQTTQIYLDISQQTVDRSMEKWNENGFQRIIQMKPHCPRKKKVFRLS